MTLQLTSAENRALRNLLQVLSTPLEYADSVAWRSAALDHIPALFGVDRGMFMLPVRDTPILSRGIDGSVERAYMEYYIHRDEGMARAVATRVETVSQRRLYGPGLEGTEVFNDLFRPHGLVGSVIAFAHVGEPCSFLAVPDIRMHRDAAREEWAVGVMELVTSVFRAGVGLELKSRNARSEVEQLFTDSGEAAVLYSVRGEMHRNPAFAGAIAGDPHAEVVCAAAAELARSALKVATGASSAPCLTELNVKTSRRGYRLNASVLGESLLLREPVAVVWVSVQTPSTHGCREAFGFTVREAEVADLIAQGCTTRQIAETLNISWHTARRHTERILAKLNVSTRAAAAGRLHSST